MRKGKRKFIWIGHYGCSVASELVRVKIRGDEPGKPYLTLRPHWTDKWHVAVCPACGEEHKAVAPMWRKGTTTEWEAAMTLREADRLNPVTHKQMDHKNRKGSGKYIV